MKVDWYTKIILSVIATCLIVIVTRDIQFTPEAHAQVRARGVTQVEIVGIEESQRLRWEPIKVQIVSIEEDRGLPWERLPVENE